MLRYILAISALTITVSAQANTSVKAAYVCEQEDGDQWYSVGLVPSLAPSKYNIVVVYNNEDDGTKTRLEDSAASLHANGQGLIAYNKSSTMKLEIATLENGSVGALTMLADGPGSAKIDLICYTDSDISYDSLVEAEPRISVGR